MNTMKIQKQYLEIFYITLKETAPVLAIARIRDAFLKKLGLETDTFISDRKKIAVNFCVKNEDGTPKVTDGKFSFPNESMEALGNELKVINEEEVEFATVPKEIKEVMKITTHRFKDGEVDSYDKVMALL